MKIFLSKTAQKELGKIPRNYQIKVSKNIDFLIEFPYLGKKLSGKLQSKYSLRAWPYRIVYTVNKKEKTIIIERISHRQDIY